MKRFQFPLERVRRWRSEQADLEAMKLERLFSELRTLELRQKELLAERAEADAALSGRNSVSAQELSSLDSFRQYISMRSQALEGMKKEQEKKIARQREALMEAERKRELLDRLRKKNLLAWRTENDKEQEALAAEMFLARRNINSSLP